MKYEDNAAGRLHEVLTVLRDTPGNTRISRAVGRAFEVDGDDPAAVLGVIPNLLRLSQDAHIAVARATEGEAADAELFLAWVNPVRTAFASLHLLDRPVQSVTSQIGESHMLSLRAAARELSRLVPDGSPPGSNREEALRLLGELLEELREAGDLDQKTRRLLVRHASALQMALQMSWAFGPEAVEDALMGALGAGMAAATVDQSNQGSDTWRAFWNTMTNISTLLTIGSSTLVIGSAITGMLPSV